MYLPAMFVVGFVITLLTLALGFSMGSLHSSSECLNNSLAALNQQLEMNQ